MCVDSKTQNSVNKKKPGRRAVVCLYTASEGICSLEGQCVTGRQEGAGKTKEKSHPILCDPEIERLPIVWAAFFLFEACTNLKRKACDCFCAPYLCHRLMRLMDFTLRPQRKINKEPQRTKERIESLMVSWNFETIFYNIV